MISIKSPEEIKKIRESCRLVAKLFQHLKEIIKPGITTKYLDEVCYNFIRSHGAYPAFLGYRGFPASICTSVNHQVVHGIPSDEKLKGGDIISIDLGILLRGYYGDATVTFPVGEIDEDAKRLLEVTHQALYEGISKARIGNRLFDISHAIQRYVEGNGFSVVRDFVGHGIGTSMHEAPQIPNFGEPGCGPRLKAGMVLCLEPMVNLGDWRIEVLGDGWTIVTRDRSLSAHFEHTIVIGEDGPEVLTEIEGGKVW